MDTNQQVTITIRDFFGGYETRIESPLINSSVGVFDTEQQAIDQGAGAKAVIDALIEKSSIKSSQLPRGVTRDGSLFRARIRINGKRKSLGSFRTIELASLAYEDARLKSRVPIQSQ